MKRTSIIAMILMGTLIGGYSTVYGSECSLPGQTGVVEPCMEEQSVLRYSHIDVINAGLSITGGTVKTTGSVSSSAGNTASVTTELQQYKNGSWTTIKTWSGSNIGVISAGGSYAVAKGYSYRVYVTGKVLDSSGKTLETATNTSKTVTY